MCDDGVHYYGKLQFDILASAFFVTGEGNLRNDESEKLKQEVLSEITFSPTRSSPISTITLNHSPHNSLTYITCRILPESGESRESWLFLRFRFDVLDRTILTMVISKCPRNYFPVLVWAGPCPASARACSMIRFILEQMEILRRAWDFFE